MWISGGAASPLAESMPEVQGREGVSDTEQGWAGMSKLRHLGSIFRKCWVIQGATE